MKRIGKKELALAMTLSMLGGGLGMQAVQAADVAVTTDQTGPVYAATGDGVESNNLTIGSDTAAPTITGSAYGGMGTSGGAYSDTNTVTLNNGTVMENLYGTYDTEAATLSTATVKAGTVQGSVYGSYSQNGTANYSHVYIGTDTANTGAISIGGSVYGAYSGQGDAGSNSVEIDRGTVKGDVYGGSGIGGSGSSVTLGAANSTSGPSIGGSVYGGNTPGGMTYQNVVTVNSGSVAGTVYGASGATTTYNTVTVNGGTITDGIYGSYSPTGGMAENNTITLQGGKVSGDIYGGYAGTSGSSSNNTINLYSTDLSAANLYGSGNASAQGNTLNVYTLGNTVANLGAFQNLNFYVPAEAATNTAAMLTVTGTADVTGSTISAAVQDISAFTKDQVITLLTDSNGITGLDSLTSFGTLAEGTLTDAGFAQTGFYLTQSSDGNSVLLTIGTQPTADSGSDDNTVVAGDNVEISSAGSTATYGDFKTSYLAAKDSNIVTVKSGDLTGDVYGSYIAGGDAFSNEVRALSGTITGSVIGAHSTGGADNVVTIGADGSTDGPTITQDVSGTDIAGTSGSTTTNYVNIYGGSVAGNVYGARGFTATHNYVSLYGGTVNDLYGSYGSDSGSHDYNSVSIYGGTVKGNIYGSYDENGSVSGNMINLYGGDLTAANLYGGVGNSVSDNSLNVYSVDNTVASISGFQVLNFYVPNDVVNGDTMLTVTGSADITNAVVSAGVNSLAAYSGGKTITLITDTNGLTGLDSVTTGILTDSGFATSGMTITKSDDGKSIILTIGSGSENGNTTDVNGQTVDNSVYGAYSAGSTNLTGNSVKITARSITGNVYGAYSEKGDVDTNGVDAYSGIISGKVYGAYTNGGKAVNNTVSVASGTVNDDIIGAYGVSGHGNSVTVGATGTDGPTLNGNVYGGDSTGTIYSNTVNVNSGTISGAVYGARGLGTTYNTVNMNGGTVETGIYGGYSATNGSVDHNTVNLNGGTVSGSIYAGYSEKGSTSDNTLNLYGGSLSGASLYGGVGATTTGGNTLNVYSLKNTVENLGDFQNINFYVPAATRTGSTMLTVTGTADVTDTVISAAVKDLTAYTGKTVINLLTDSNGITGLDTSSFGTVTDAGFATTGFTLSKSKDGKTVLLTIGSDTTNILPHTSDDTADSDNTGNEDNDKANQSTDPDAADDHTDSGNTSSSKANWADIHLNSQTKILPESRLAGFSMLRQAGDFLTGAAYHNVAATADRAQTTEYVPFAIGSVGKIKDFTGSYIENHGMGLDFGFARRLQHSGSTVTLVPFFEYGHGNYTGHLDDGTRGDGKNTFMGAGFLARRDNASGYYYEGSVRAGHAKTDYSGTIAGYAASYDSDSNYVAMHVGAGKLIPSGTKDQYDLYGKFFWTHQAGDHVMLNSSLGQAPYDFDAINSYRTRLGLRWTHQTSKNQSIYAGLAWDYEFSGTEGATYRGLRTLEPSLKGSSAVMELGWQRELTKDSPWGLDIGLMGYAGKQQGAMFHTLVTWKF